MKTLIVISLLALAPAGAKAGANTGPTAALDGVFADLFGTNEVVERKKRSCGSGCE